MQGTCYIRGGWADEDDEGSVVEHAPRRLTAGQECRLVLILLTEDL